MLGPAARQAVDGPVPANRQGGRQNGTVSGPGPQWSYRMGQAPVPRAHQRHPSPSRVPLTRVLDTRAVLQLYLCVNFFHRKENTHLLSLSQKEWLILQYKSYESVFLLHSVFFPKKKKFSMGRFVSHTAHANLSLVLISSNCRPRIHPPPRPSKSCQIGNRLCNLHASFGPAAASPSSLPISFTKRDWLLATLLLSKV